jgi:hypothetical protein
VDIHGVSQTTGLQLRGTPGRVRRSIERCSTNQLVSFFDGDRTRILVATVISCFAFLELLWFGAAPLVRPPRGRHGRLRRNGDGRQRGNGCDPVRADDDPRGARVQHRRLRRRRGHVRPLRPACPLVPVFDDIPRCVRQVPAVGQMTYDFADVGMPVDVIARS